MTYEEDTTGIPDTGIIEAAARFRRGIVDGHNPTFAPSIAQFCKEARRCAEEQWERANRGRPRQIEHKWVPQPPETRIRMGFKMSVLSAGLALGRVDEVAEANKRGLDEMIALGQQWGVPVPEELWAQIRKSAA